MSRFLKIFKLTSVMRSKPRKTNFFQTSDIIGGFPSTTKKTLLKIRAEFFSIMFDIRKYLLSLQSYPVNRLKKQLLSYKPKNRLCEYLRLYQDTSSKKQDIH